MRLAGPILIGLLAAACAGAGPVPSAPGPTATPRPMTALDLLECDGDPSEVGSEGEEVAVTGAGQTPEEALDVFLRNSPWVIPQSGYERFARSGDRHAFAYRAGGEVKVVVVVSSRFGELMGGRYTADELRTCPESEFGQEAEFVDDRRVWTHQVTGAILTDIAGPAHCGWQNARMMHLEENGVLAKQYVRDPDGLFPAAQLRDSYAEDVELPDDATDSGYRSPKGYELWFTDADSAAYVVTPDGVERWPRAVDMIGCT